MSISKHVSILGLTKIPLGLTHWTLYSGMRTVNRGIISTASCSLLSLFTPSHSQQGPWRALALCLTVKIKGKNIEMCFISGLGQVRIKKASEPWEATRFEGITWTNVDLENLWLYFEHGNPVFKTFQKMIPKFKHAHISNSSFSPKQNQGSGNGIYAITFCPIPD